MNTVDRPSLSLLNTSNNSKIICAPPTRNSNSTSPACKITLKPVVGPVKQKHLMIELMLICFQVATEAPLNKMSSISEILIWSKRLKSNGHNNKITSSTRPNIIAFHPRSQVSPEIPLPLVNNTDIRVPLLNRGNSKAGPHLASKLLIRKSHRKP